MTSALDPDLDPELLADLGKIVKELAGFNHDFLAGLRFAACFVRAAADVIDSLDCPHHSMSPANATIPVSHISFAKEETNE